MITREKISVEELKQKNSDFIGAISQTSFYHYTTVTTAEKILTGSPPCFFLSSISKMNDRNEAELHNQDGHLVFSLCFCNSESDNIPMWYLYGGITGDGVSIGLTPNAMLKFVEDLEFIYGVKNNQIDFDRKLYNGVDFEIECGWIYYYNNSLNTVTYRGKTYELIGSSVNLCSNNYFLKDSEWRYEKEFRIVVRLVSSSDRSVPEKIAIPFDKKALIKQGGLKVKLSPELKIKFVSLKKYASKFGLPDKKIKVSKLNVKMDLLKRNQESIVQNFEAIVKRLSPKDIDRICSTIKPCRLCYRIESDISVEKGDLINV